jgi:hypothetical protein
MGRISVLLCSGWVAACHLRKRGDEEIAQVLRHHSLQTTAA